MKTKMMILIASFGIIYSILSIIHYNLEHHFHLKVYFTQLGVHSFIATATIAFVWINIWIIQKNKKNEAKVSHTPFTSSANVPRNPDILECTHPLEAEVMYLLERHKDFPYAEQGKPFKNLYSHSKKAWEDAKSAPNSTALEHIFALSHGLCQLYCFNRIETHAPLWKFWQRNHISYQKISSPKGTLSGIVLADLPSFTELTEEEQTTLCTALSYVFNNRIPDNLPNGVYILLNSYNSTKKGA